MAMSLDMLEEAAYRFALLGDPTRLRIVHTLMAHDELSVQAVAEAAATSRYNASAHLNRLALARLVARRRVGSTVFYRVDDAKLPAICDWMCDSLRSRARSLVS